MSTYQVDTKDVLTTYVTYKYLRGRTGPNSVLGSMNRTDEGESVLCRNSSN
jgi:hypothetical protein